MARYIDADAIRYTNDIHNCNDLQLAFKHEIDAIPTADVQPVIHGHWVNRRSLQGMAVCSVCGADSKFGFGKYCQWCGAKMDEGDING